MEEKQMRLTLRTTEMEHHVPGVGVTSPRVGPGRRVREGFLQEKVAELSFDFLTIYPARNQQLVVGHPPCTRHCATTE
jgi:hypothetical protein